MTSVASDMCKSCKSPYLAKQRIESWRIDWEAEEGNAQLQFEMCSQTPSLPENGSVRS